MAFTLAMLIVGTGPGVVDQFSIYDLVVGTAGLALVVLFIVQTVLTARHIALEEGEG